MLIKFAKKICKRTFGYFTPHFYKTILMYSFCVGLLLFLVWYGRHSDVFPYIF